MAKKDELQILPPRENPDLFGHDAAQARFLQDFDAGRLHHAYLITGPKGIGKATFAYRMARYILSQGALSAAPSQEEQGGFSLFGEMPETSVPVAKTRDMQMPADDPLFRRIAGGSHTDLLSLSPAYDPKKQTEKSQISVEEARKVPSFMSLTPAEGAWRVVIVDAVDQLNNNAANALLKIMEEPPAQALLLLVCHEPGAILPTIRSRCRQFLLDVPDRPAFEKVLTTVAPHIEVTDYAALYALAQGSPGLAITLHKHDGLAHYQGWLKALAPNASDSQRAKFTDSAAAIKSPEGWAMLLHAWDTLMHRISLYPHQNADQPIFRGDAELVAAIATSSNFATRQSWMASARSLIHLTDTYNLDKRTTVRLMLDPARLTQQFPAAA